MKRSGAPSADDSAAKHRRVQESDDANNGDADFDICKSIEPHINHLEKIQISLQEIDEECARKQMQIQKEFDEKKKPIFNERQAIISKIPEFWSRCIRNHPAMAFLVEADTPLLNLLSSIEIDDNIDDNGSYHIKFVFSQKAQEHFTPTTLEKLVRFQGDGEETVEQCTKIQWVNTKENPVQVAIKGRAVHRESEGMDEDEEEDTGFPFSFFEWFTEEPWPQTRQDIGELIRRELWHSPLNSFLADEDDDDDILDDSGGDEDEDEVDDEEDDKQDDED